MTHQGSSDPSSSRYLRTTQLAYSIAKQLVPTYAHPKSPHRFTQKQLVACVLLADYFKMSHRAFTDWLKVTDQICEALELDQIPNHSTLSRTKQRLGKAKLRELKQQFAQSEKTTGKTVL